MKRAIFAAAFFLIFIDLMASALAQNQGNGVLQTGQVTPGHAAAWRANGVIGDAGGSNGSATLNSGYITALGITATGTPFCINDALINAAGGYHQFCIGANALGGGLLSYNPYGGASPLGININLNGTNYPFPGAGNGNVVGPTSPTPTVGDVAVWNGGTTIKDGGLPTSTVATNAALVASCASVSSCQAGVPVYSNGVWRADFSANLGAPPLWFVPETGTCAANSRVSDGGSCVNTSGGDGNSFYAVFPAAGASPMEWGPSGNGSTDDTAKIQAAVTWANTSGVPLVFDGIHKFLISTGLTGNGTPDIRGPASLPGVYATTCPFGIIVNSNITAFSFTGASGSIDSICVQMATSAGLRASGAAISAGSPGTTNQTNFRITNNTILNPYDGILIGGPTIDGTHQTNGTYAGHNVVVNPSHYGIGHGLTSMTGSTAGTLLDANQIACFSANSGATGIAILDGAVELRGTDVGPFGCNVGTALTPQSGQQIDGLFSGVLGDTSITNGLLIDPAFGGEVINTRFVGAWMVFGANATQTQALLTGAGLVKDILFSGCFFGSFLNQSTPIVDVETGGNVTITGSHITADGGGTTTGAGIKVGTNNGNPSFVNITGNFIGSGSGVMALGVQLATTSNSITTISSNTIGATTGVSVTGSSNVFSILDNLFNSTTPISYSPNNESAQIANNGGVDNLTPTVASAASVTLPVNSTVEISGTTAITTLNGMWSNRKVTLVPTGSGLAFNTGGNICNTVSPAQFASVSATWLAGNSCWSLR